MYLLLELSANNPGTYVVTSPNCTTEAINVGDAGVGNIGWDGIWEPWYLSDFLNGLTWPPPPCP
ncbi:MAG: hypothetical protein ACR2H1_06275 [Limisphaerales bacterium]